MIVAISLELVFVIDLASFFNKEVSRRCMHLLNIARWSENCRRGRSEVPRRYPLFRRLNAKARPSMPRPGPNTTTGSPRSCPKDLTTSKRQGLCPVQIGLLGGKQ